jgi:AcrR family transcriptional regulator
LGYEGASIADIGKAAKVPKSLVQYHFGTKEELWEACLQDKAVPMMEAVDKFLNSDSADPRELIAARFHFLRENPDMRRMLFWACMSPGPMPSFIHERRGKILQKFGGDGKSRQFARFLAALSATDGWFLFRNFYRGPFGDAVFDEDLELRLLEVLLESVNEK